jgi:hypothetical protein
MSASKNIPDFRATIAGLRAIVAASGNARLTEGPVNPDDRLLELCADALFHLSHAQKSYDARDRAWLYLQGQEREAAIARDDRLFEEFNEGERVGKPTLNSITKIKATTAAGIYAKAAVVRASKTGAACLARSLATDLLDCPGLRAGIWPATED